MQVHFFENSPKFFLGFGPQKRKMVGLALTKSYYEEAKN